jgi:two-component system CheB/CheR fusion protein
MPIRYLLSILIVEADPETAETLEQDLELTGHSVRVAVSGWQATDMLIGFCPDVAILNIVPPGLEGYKTARKLCRALSRRPVLIALTGHPDLEELSRSEGFDHHFLKPVDPYALSDLLEKRAESNLLTPGLPPLRRGRWDASRERS